MLKRRIVPCLDVRDGQVVKEYVDSLVFGPDGNLYVGIAGRHSTWGYVFDKGGRYLRTFCPVGAILFDHPDPSIFTVLTAPSGVPGTANIDFVLFRERWMVAEDTFRPPWYHKNIMSELMGNIYGQYDAKPQGFVPGGMSLHNMMLPHGPDLEAFEKASNANLGPDKLDRTMSFMFETRFPQHLTEFAGKEAPIQDNYIDCWTSLEKKFDGTPGKK